jgi:integrase
MQHRANPMPETIETVPGYPSNLKLFRIPASSYWQVRAFLGGRIVKKSSKTKNKAEAIKVAKAFYNGLLLKQSQNQPLTDSPTFERVALALLQEDQGRVDRGERSKSLVSDAKYIFNKDLVPFFRRDHVKNITYQRISEYVEYLKKRSVGSNTIKNHFIYLRKLLKHAHKMEMIDKLPIFPTISTQDNPREWFNDEQYEALQRAIRKAIQDKVVVRYVPITEELRDLTNFMMNTFLRPQDIKLLQNKHITVAKKADRSYLRIMAKGKTVPAPVISTQAAVTIYERIKREPEDFVFFPQMKNRDYAMSTMSKQFKYVLEKAKLKKGDDGQERTLYSLRHTCIMNQLLHGKWPLLTLARNCRTSPEMINRFYGSHLEAEMNVSQLHQQVESGATLEDFFESQGDT